MFDFAKVTENMTTVEILNYYRNRYYAEPQVTERGIVANAINDVLPNMVEVVRCKDCKHKGWIQEPCHGKSVDYCRALDFCINNAEKCFCYYGERKDNGTTQV